MSEQVWLRGTSYVGRLAKEYELAIPNVHQALTRINPSGRGPGRIVDASRAALDLGARNVVIHCPFATSWDEPEAQAWQRAVDASKELIQGTHTQLSLENSGVSDRTDANLLLGPLPDLVAYAERQDISLTLDTCHAGTHSVGLDDALEAVQSRLSNVHFSDYRPGPLSGNMVCRGFFSHHQVPGDGSLALAPFMCALAKSGYEGPIALETSPISLRYWSPSRMKQRLAGARDFCIKALACDSPN